MNEIQQRYTKMSGNGGDGDDGDDEMSRVKRKVKLLFQGLLWMFCYLAVLAYCIPGIVIAVQYSEDKCVTSNLFNLELDIWLMIGCCYMIGYMMVTLCALCSIRSSRRFYLYYGISHALFFIWLLLGMYLEIKSSLNCPHDSLWAMSIAFSCITFVFLAIEFFIYFCAYRCCTCPGLSGMQDNLYQPPPTYPYEMA